MDATAGQVVQFRGELTESAWQIAFVLRNGGDAQNGINVFVLDETRPFIRRGVLSIEHPNFNNPEWVEEAYLKGQVNHGSGGQWRPAPVPPQIADLHKEVDALREQIAKLSKGRKEPALA